MKRIVLWMMAMMFMGGLAMAQNGQRGGGQQMDPKERATRMTERMVKEYSLNDTQKQQLQEANVAWVEKMGTRTRGERGKKSEVSKEDREKMMKEMKEAREAYEKELQKILTKEQFADYTKKQAERESRMRNRQ